MKCPRCKFNLDKAYIEELLSDAKFENVEVDKCPNCNGVWFDEGELRRVDEKIEPKIIEIKSIPSLKEQYVDLNCPNCENSIVMDKVLSELDKDVVMDVCPSCKGIWLDGGEFDAIKERSVLNLAINALKWVFG